MFDRRKFLQSSLAAAVSPLAAGCGKSAPWGGEAYRKKDRSRVAVLEARSYEVSLQEVILRGIRLFGVNVEGKRVVLKPNIVEFDPAHAINTNPAVIVGAIEAFRSLGAREVVVAEGPGHRRDNEHLLTASGLFSLLKEHRVDFVDLNNDDVQALKLQSHFTSLGQLYFPQTVLTADLLVSMPKLKTHHWTGVTLSLKNMFGIIPGAIYGWPKNTLHWAGIHRSILDINSTIPVPRFAIVDGIIGMQGNGPIQGDPKFCGALLFSDDPVAVDATAARLMKIDPAKIEYLARAGEFLGNLARENIEQIGENPERFQQEFKVLPSFQELRALNG